MAFTLNLQLQTQKEGHYAHMHSRLPERKGRIGKEQKVSVSWKPMHPDGKTLGGWKSAGEHSIGGKGYMLSANFAE
jgi:hypothetical protein